MGPGVSRPRDWHSFDLSCSWQDLKQADILIGAICEVIVRAGLWHRIPICFTAPYRIRQGLGAEQKHRK
jgi:hypothetical protein